MAGVMEAKTDTAAKTIRGETWRADSVNPAVVTQKLEHLWTELSGPKPLRTGIGIRQAVDGDTFDGANVLARANTANLMVFARSLAQARRAEEAILRLTNHYPSRAIVLVADPTQIVPALGPAEPSSDSALLDIRVGLIEQTERRGRTTGRFECVTVEGAPSAIGNPVSIASPLLVPELPDFTWWPGDILADLGVFRDMVAISNRVIVDSATLGDAGRGLPVLAGLVRGLRPATFLSDFAWARLRDWRNVIAQFFDAADMRVRLTGLSEVSIDYAMETGDAGSGGGLPGLTGAALLTGWLATRLGWTTLQPPDRTRTGLRIIFRAGTRGQPVVVRLRPAATASRDDVGLASVILVAQEPASGRFSVERSPGGELMTTSETSDMPAVSRMVYSSLPDNATLLEAELQQFGRDRVFEESLTFTSDLFARR